MKISIVLPVLNEEANLPACLDSIASQLQDGDEIIIVDNGSIDRSIKVASRYPTKIYLFPGAKLGETRRFGVQQAQNPIVLEAAGDLLFTQGFLDGHRKHYENNQVVGVRGNMLDHKGRLIANLTYGVGSNVLNWGHACFSYRKEIYDATGGHRPISLGEDVLLWNEIRKLGLTVQDKDLIVYHTGPSSDKYVRNASYLIGGSLLTGGALYEAMEKAQAGYAAMGHGLGWVLGQAGVDLGINKDAPPNHFHHWMLGLMILAGTVGFSDELPTEIETGLYGIGSGLVAHDLLTEGLSEPQLRQSPK